MNGEGEFIAKLCSKGVFPTLKFFMKNVGRSFTSEEVVKDSPAPSSSIYKAIRFLTENKLLDKNELHYSMSEHNSKILITSIQRINSLRGLKC